MEDASDPLNADGVRGHLVAVGDSSKQTGVYDRCIKRVIDLVLSLCGLIVLSPVFLIVALLIVIDDPGPVFLHKNESEEEKSILNYISSVA